MAEEGRPWWKSSQVNGSPSLGLKQSPSKSNTVIQKPWDHSSVSVKKEPVNSFHPSPLCIPPAFSPSVSKSAAPSSPFKSVVKRELPDIKDEPMAYIERALVKGEFPRDFNWPEGKWDPIALQNHVKSETKTNHHIPKPLTERELKLRFAAPPRRRGPPPDWHYIYTRERYEPGPYARSWWNTNVERALNRRREAYLQTKLNDNAPVEVRMERIWAFEVAKGEVRRIIAESKWKASAREGGNTPDSDAVNFGASTSRDTGCNAADRTSSIQDRLGPIPTIHDRLGRLPVVGEAEDEKKEESEESPPTEEMEATHPDEIQVIPQDKENVEVLTLEEEIEDAMSNSEDDSSDIRIDCEPGSNDVIFIQKKQGEVTFLAQVDGRVIKMNRKRKLCVTVSNTLNAKRNRVITLGTESEELKNSTEKEETNSDVSETEDMTIKQGDETTSVEDTCDTTSDSQSTALQEFPAVETTVKNLFQDENKQESNSSVESINVTVNTCVEENKGYAEAQSLQGQITADILTENVSKSFATDDIEELALSDDEPEFIGSASQKVTSKDKEADIPENPKVDVAVVTDIEGVNDTQDSIKEDIVFLETVKSVHSRVQSVPADGDLSGATFKQENNRAEFSISDVTEEACDYENEKTMRENNLEEDNDLKEGFVEIQCTLTSGNMKSKGGKSTVKTFCDTEADVCEIGSYVTEKENKDVELGMEKKASDIDEDVLEIDVSEEELVVKCVNSSECDTGDSSVEECEKDENMLVGKNDDSHESSLENQLDQHSFGEESNSCDVEVVEVDEEIEIVRENLMPHENIAHKTGRMQLRISKSTEQDTGMSNRNNTRRRTGGDTETRVTRRSAIISEKKQHSSKKETDGHSSFNTGVRTRSRKR